MSFFTVIRFFVSTIAASMLVCAGAWGAGITVPSGSTLNVNSATLNVAGDVTNAGTLQTSSGTIGLTGNWSNSGAGFTPNTGTVDFSGSSGTQTINTGAVANAFYNLTHSGAGTAQVSTYALTINHDFTNSAGTFDAANLDMAVSHDWNNTATFTPGTNTVTLNGTDQTIKGITSNFYKLTKTVTSPDTLTFQDINSSATGQTVTRTLTLKGAASNLLSIRSTTSATYAKISLQAGGSQAIQYVNVKDSDASGGLLLVAGTTSTDSGHNLNWSFSNATLTWTGTVSTDWGDPFNWDLGFVPASGDTAVIPSAPSNQPSLTATSGDVTVGYLTINANATVTLSGHNLNVTNTLSNSGTIKLFGSETVAIGTVNTNAGTFEYDGNGDSTQDTFDILSKITITAPADNVFYNLTINDTHATPDIFTINTAALKIYGGLTVSGGTLQAASGTIDVDGAVSINGGTLVAPSATSATAFTVGGNWSNTAGTFTNSSGKVTLDTTATALVTGNTTFYDLASTTAGKIIQFTAGSQQTVSQTLTLTGDRTSKVTLQSSSSGNAWSINVPNGAQVVNALDVKDSNALTNTVTCLNCTDSGHNNANWIFATLIITAPDNNNRTVGQTPTIIGQGPLSSNITIKDVNNTVVATARTDKNGNFRTVVGQDNDTDSSTTVAAGTQLAVSTSANDNALAPYYLGVAGFQNNLTVVPNPTTSQVPTITSPTSGQRVNGSKPTFVGLGQAGQTATVVANDANGVLLLTEVGTGSVDSAGNYSVTLTTALPRGTNYISVTVAGVASSIINIALTNPFGVVFDSTSNKLIKGASVALYKPNGQLAQRGTDLDASDTNPFITGADGLYGFLAAIGNYTIAVSAEGYTYPSQETTFPSGRVVVTGSKGEAFTVGTDVVEIDHPVDANGFLLRIEKDANKAEARIGDVVTYSVKIQNLSNDNAVNNFLIDDKIPPGFKYLPNRVLLDGLPTSEPSGQRPLVFSIATIDAGATRMLRYQLVIGSGVTTGEYKNVAVARYAKGRIISNRTTKVVKVILDPLFDLGSLLGKVFYDWNENGVQDAPEYDATEEQTIIEKPLPNVQLMMEDGTVITADREGKFNVPGLLPGRHILRLDERTLPPGAFLTTDKAVIVDVTPGSIVKVNFGVNMDNAQIVSEDAQFFNEQIQLTQNHDQPQPRLNAALFNASPQAGADEEIVVYEGIPVRQVEFRIFTNYAPFIDHWRLDIMDRDTKVLVKRFEGSRFNIHDPVFWSGRDQKDQIVRPDHHYAYALAVTDDHGISDETKEKPIHIRVIKDDMAFQKEKEETPEELKTRAENYLQWLKAQEAVNNTQHQLIRVAGETLHINRQGADIKAVRVMKDGQLFAEIPVTQQYGLTPKELMTGGLPRENRMDNLETVLPNGDYTLEVIGANASKMETSDFDKALALPANGSLPSAGAGSPASAGRGQAPPSAAGLKRFTRKLKVGDDYLMFVALGDAQVGYNINRGNIEPVQSDKRYQSGFWQQGKGAYYLKGKILGKYLVTSSFDTDRQQKELFRKLDPNTYYPIYGDNSSINYDATNTQGPLYLLVEWDKSSAIWGNYAVDFNDTEFAAFSRNLYGGKIAYQSLASNPYGEARTKVVVFHAQVQQRPSHNEFLGTGGSLYFLKNKKIVQGSDKIKLEIRDRVTGLVIASKDMKNGADYELDEGEGRILFWQPVAMIAKAESIVSSDLLDGNPVYVVADYQYELKDTLAESSQGVRVAQAVGSNVVVGGTYVRETQALNDYQLKATDVTAHLGPDAKVKAEYAQSNSQGTGTFVSTDGGITFTELNAGNAALGKAYGISGDARLFDRMGLTSYYKWVENSFATPGTSSQQGKELAGMALTFDVTPMTRITARRDLQRLMDNTNTQVKAQVGASETTVTMAQIVHESQRLKLTGAYEVKQVKQKIDQFETTTNEVGKTLAGKAEYQLNGRVSLSLGQQFDVLNPRKNVTTLGTQIQATDRLVLRGQEAFSKEGTATTAGATVNATDQLALSTDYTVAHKRSGDIEKTAAISAEQKVNDRISTTAAVAMTNSSTGTKTTNASLGTKAKLSEGTSLEAVMGAVQSSNGQRTATASLSGNAKVLGNSNVEAKMGVAQSAAGGRTNTASLTSTTQVDENSSLKAVVGVGQTAQDQANAAGAPAVASASSTTVSLEANRKIDDKTESSSKVQIDDNAQGGKTTTLTFAEKRKINDELQAVSQKTFGIAQDGTKEDSKYALVREKEGRKLEASLTRQLADQKSNISQSNIFGLSGDVNDKLALQGSVEKGKVQNLDGSRTDRTALALAAGYVLKDTETAVERLKNSTKIELRMDSGPQNKRQFVFTNALQGKLTDNISVNAKLDYSKTFNATTGHVEERHKEIILGAAYRPVNFDRLNLIGEYTYKENQAPEGQVSSDTGIERNRMQVFNGQAIYDIDDNWQLAEKFAYRINDEKVAGFEFNRTHTWLMIHRINYHVDRNWTIGGEYRRLTQVEAKDNKQGLLLEATRNINDNAQLGVGWNFTQFSDDLINLSYTSQGPFLRMSGKLYDRTPEEKARARAKWLDEKITQWAWAMVRKELAKKDSKVVVELNRLFVLAKDRQAAGQYEESRQVYKDIIAAGQMMFDEAAEYIRGQISFEEQLQQYNKTAEDYFKGGEYLKAGKMWEKIVADASLGVLK